MNFLKPKKIIRIYHPWWKWECYKNGFYDSQDKIALNEGKQLYSKFLSNEKKFESAIKKVFIKWPYSCEHFLSNESINRIAWIGQASMCLECHISCFSRSGFFLLNKKKRQQANNLANNWLCLWIENKIAEIYMREKIKEYIEKWKKQGYRENIPDAVPEILMSLNLAPSYKAIALAILKNDNTLKGLGFCPPKSEWYDKFKRIELETKGIKLKKRHRQLTLFGKI